MFPATRWRLGPPLCPCFEAPSLSEADLVPAMTASCGLSLDGLGRPHSKMHQWRRTRVTNKFRWPSCSGPGRYSSSPVQPGRGCRRRIPVSVSLGRSAVSVEEEVDVFRWCLVYAVLALIRVTLWRERHDGLHSENLVVENRRAWRWTCTRRNEYLKSHLDWVSGALLFGVYKTKPNNTYFSRRHNLHKPLHTCRCYPRRCVLIASTAVEALLKVDILLKCSV